WAPLVGDPPEPRREEHEDRSRRRVREPGGERGEAEELQVEREEEEHPAERAVDEQRLQVRDGEVPPAEQVERQHRLREPRLQQQKAAERDTGGDERPPDAAEAVIGPADEAVRQ